ncbi:hypothetical protein BDN70DRAFT_775931, partial [Pholiota conissans]
FEVVRCLHSTPQVSGRATRVWLVRRKGRYYVLKDSWPLQMMPFSEIRHLLKINHTIMNDEEMRDSLKHTYPTLIVGQELGDSTDIRRVEVPHKPHPRIHRRIVTKPIGDPLTSFRSKFELCSVLCDVVTYLRYSAEKCKICHGDISLNNIVINRIWDNDDGDEEINDNIDDINVESISSSSGNRSNSCSDNMAPNIVVNENSASKIAGFGMGTLPFMALDALKWKIPTEFKHLPKHDLESLFYVIITLCTYVNGPGCLRPSTPVANEPSLCLNEWWATYDHHSLARQKGVMLSTFKDYILERLPPYWNDF